MTLWIKVTNDKYELPVAVADTAQKLADMVGATKDAVVTGAWHHRNDGKWSSYRKVVIEDD